MEKVEKEESNEGEKERKSNIGEKTVLILRK